MEKLGKITFVVGCVLTFILAMYYGVFRERYDAGLFWLAVSFYILWADQG